MPAQERVRAIGIQRSDALVRRLGKEARAARLRAGVSQAQLASALGCSRQWIGDMELGRLRSADARRITLLFAHLGHKLVINAYPTDEPMRDAGQLRLLERFNARLAPDWRRFAEAVMPVPGDLRAWDEMLRGPVSIGVEAETRPSELHTVERSMGAKQRDSGVDRMILVLAASAANRQLVQDHIGMLRQTFPLDTRATLAALAAGRDPGANGLVLI
jgi:transcriptional regulator with XRE-family HTH domain